MEEVQQLDGKNIFMFSIKLLRDTTDFIYLILFFGNFIASLKNLCSIYIKILFYKNYFKRILLNGRLYMILSTMLEKNL